MRRLALCGTLLLLVTALPLAQQTPDYRVEVRLIEVEARVTDRTGRPVLDLQRGDFVLTENGVPHDVANATYIHPGERTVPVPPEARTPDGPAFVTIEPAPTWIYVSAEVGLTDLTRAGDALRRFLMTQLQPGFRVSLAGRPFTDDRAALLQIADELIRGPFGKDGRAGLVDPQQPFVQDAEEERAFAHEFRLQEEGIAPLAGFPSRLERVETNASYGRPAYLTEGRMDRQLPLYGDVALNRYDDLVKQLSTLPGKKVVVLLRPGLRIEMDNIPAMVRVAGRAAKHRVSFYTVDSRGLEAVIPADEKKIAFFLDRRQRQTVDVLGKLDMQDRSQEGLTSLATETNGRAITDTNRLGEIFDSVVRDASGYYLLGYHPVDLTEGGKYRRIKVAVKKPGVKVAATRGYYEGLPTSMKGPDKGLALRRAMMGDLPSDLPVVVSPNLFAVGDGSPALVLSAGVPAGALKAGDGSTDARLNATALFRIASDDPSRLPVYYERQLSSTPKRTDWARLQLDQTVSLSVSDVVMLSPGRHTWRVVFRDESSGRLGGAEGQVTVPDFRQAGAPTSSLLMTAEVLRRSDEAGAIEDDVFDAGPLRFTPQPLRVFRQGTTVHLLFDLYNPRPEDLADAAKGPRLALLKDGRPVQGVVVHGEAFPDAGRRRIRYACAVQTSGLEAGRYAVLVAPPASGASASEPLRQFFLLLPES